MDNLKIRAAPRIKCVGSSQQYEDIKRASSQPRREVGGQGNLYNFFFHSYHRLEHIINALVSIFLDQLDHALSTVSMLSNEPSEVHSPQA